MSIETLDVIWFQGLSIADQMYSFVITYLVTEFL